MEARDWGMRVTGGWGWSQLPCAESLSSEKKRIVFSGDVPWRVLVVDGLKVLLHTTQALQSHISTCTHREQRASDKRTQNTILGFHDCLQRASFFFKPSYLEGPEEAAPAARARLVTDHAKRLHIHHHKSGRKGQATMAGTMCLQASQHTKTRRQGWCKEGEV